MTSKVYFRARKSGQHIGYTCRNGCPTHADLSVLPAPAAVETHHSPSPSNHEDAEYTDLLPMALEEGGTEHALSFDIPNRPAATPAHEPLEPVLRNLSFDLPNRPHASPGGFIEETVDDPDPMSTPVVVVVDVPQAV